MFSRHKLELNNFFENESSLQNFSSQVQKILKKSEKSKKSILPSTLKDMILHYACHDQIPDCSVEEPICLNSTTIIPLDYYLKREAEVSSSGLNLKKAGILRVYGLLNNIDQQILSWINMSKKHKSSLFPFLFWAWFDFDVHSCKPSYLRRLLTSFRVSSYFWNPSKKKPILSTHIVEWTWCHKENLPFFSDLLQCSNSRKFSSYWNETTFPNGGIPRSLWNLVLSIITLLVFGKYVKECLF